MHARDSKALPHDVFVQGTHREKEQDPAGLATRLLGRLNPPLLRHGLDLILKLCRAGFDAIFEEDGHKRHGALHTSFVHGRPHCVRLVGVRTLPRWQWRGLCYLVSLREIHRAHISPSRPRRHAPEFQREMVCSGLACRKFIRSCVIRNSGNRQLRENGIVAVEAQIGIRHNGFGSTKINKPTFMIIVPSTYAVHLGPLSGEVKRRNASPGRNSKRSARVHFGAVPPDGLDEAHGATFLIRVTAVTAPAVLDERAKDNYRFLPVGTSASRTAIGRFGLMTIV